MTRRCGDNCHTDGSGTLAGERPDRLGNGRAGRQDVIDDDHSAPSQPARRLHPKGTLHVGRSLAGQESGLVIDPPAMRESGDHDTVQADGPEGSGRLAGELTDRVMATSRARDPRGRNGHECKRTPGRCHVTYRGREKMAEDSEQAEPPLLLELRENSPQRSFVDT